MEMRFYMFLMLLGCARVSVSLDTTERQISHQILQNARNESMNAVMFSNWLNVVANLRMRTRNTIKRIAGATPVELAPPIGGDTTTNTPVYRPFQRVRDRVKNRRTPTKAPASRPTTSKTPLDSLEPYGALSPTIQMSLNDSAANIV